MQGGRYFRVVLDQGESRPVCAGRPGDAFLSEQSRRDLFNRAGDLYEIKPWIAADIQWLHGDLRDKGFLASLGTHDIVLANNFLVHMDASQAEDCFRKIVRLSRPGGTFVCRGIDLDLRARLARELQLSPIATRLREIHDGDQPARASWPWEYWGVEPLNMSHTDWQWRYAAVFRIPENGTTAPQVLGAENAAPAPS